MSSITWTRSTLFSPHISLLLLPFSPSFLSFVHRHLDSSSNERPDISSLQKRIKVYFLEDRKEVHCVVRILSVMSHYCEEKVILMYFQVFLILNWREKCMKVLRSFCISDFLRKWPMTWTCAMGWWEVCSAAVLARLSLRLKWCVMLTCTLRPSSIYCTTLSATCSEPPTSR